MGARLTDTTARLIHEDPFGADVLQPAFWATVVISAYLTH